NSNLPGVCPCAKRIWLTSLPSVPNAEIGKEYCFQSGPGVKNCILGMPPALASVIIATTHGLPSPLAQKLIVFFPERFAGSDAVISPPPGENRTPDHRKPAPAISSPDTFNAPFVPLAPGSTGAMEIVDLPPFMASEAGTH